LPPSGAGETTSSFGTGFGAQNLNIAPALRRRHVHDEPGRLADNNGQLQFSADSISDVTWQLSGPATSTIPCNCITLNGRIVPASIKITNPGESGGIRLEFSIAWFMNCTTGSGGCNGQLELFPPQPAKKLKTYFKPLAARINCSTDWGSNTSEVAHSR
jgi:hypothetical protein